VVVPKAGQMGPDNFQIVIDKQRFASKIIVERKNNISIMKVLVCTSSDFTSGDSFKHEYFFPMLDQGIFTSSGRFKQLKLFFI
jgi:hypothetical protein